MILRMWLTNCRCCVVLVKKLLTHIKDHIFAFLKRDFLSVSITQFVENDIWIQFVILLNKQCNGTGLPSKVYSCLTPGVPGKDSKSTVTLTRIKCLPKMNQLMLLSKPFGFGPVMFNIRGGCCIFRLNLLATLVKYTFKKNCWQERFFRVILYILNDGALTLKNLFWQYIIYIIILLYITIHYLLCILYI